jgi:phosphodiesterase/alkaline phosphatase D-like protein
MAVTWGWSGAQTEDGFTVSFRLSTGAASARLAVSTTNFGTPTFGPSAIPDANRYVKVSIDGLAPNTLYYYRLEIDATIDTAFTGECRTLPVVGQPANFTLAAATCSATGSNSVVWDSIAARRPLVFLHGGDRHYGNINSGDVTDFHDEFELSLTTVRQKAFHRVVPMSYTWDDHDFCGNGSDGTSVGRDAANQAYRQMIPHHDLPASKGIGIYHTFDIGLVRVINTDNRSLRSPNTVTDNRHKSMLGFEQRRWFFDVLQDAVDTGIRAVVWNNSMQWSIEEASNGAVDAADCWRTYSYERALISRFMRKIGCPPVVIVSGDAHEIATRLDYRNNGMRFVVLQNAALDASTNTRKGYWDYGPVGGARHYGSLSFIDNGDDVLLLDYTAVSVNTAGSDAILWNVVVDLAERFIMPWANNSHERRRTIRSA